MFLSSMGHYNSNPKKSLEKSYSITLWLILLTILVVIGIITIGLVLFYVVVNSGIDGINSNEPPRNEAQRRAERIAKDVAKVEPIIFEFFEKSRGNAHGHSKERKRRSPLLSSSSTLVEGSSDLSKPLFRRYDDNDDIPRRECKKRSLPMCSGQVPYNATVYPNFIGDENELEANRSLPYFNYIAKSRCNRRIKQLLCSFLEPPCVDGRPIPPCKKFCRIALEGCAEYIPATLELSAAFDCRRYPDSSNPNVCVNLAIGKGCAADEFQCPDKSCIPRHWLCDGVRDCIFAADEANCSGVACSSEEFECDRKCVPLTWRCDGDRDCQDGSDEVNCTYRPGCGPDRFKCADGFGCIPKRWVCDGKAECRDGSDEIGCTQKECTRGDFKCDNGICIPQIWLCDGGDDCKDGSDERNCQTPGAPVGPSQATSQNGHPQQAHNYQNNQNNQNNHNNGHQQQRPPVHASIGPVFSHNNIYRWVYKK